MLNARSIQGIITLAIGMFIAIWLGMAIVTDQLETLVKIVGAALLIAAALLGTRIWLMFIFFTSMNVMLYRWAGTVEIGQAIFIAYCSLLFLMRKLKYQVRFTELEVWAILIIACIVQAYMRHPVGLNIFGAGNVGGRPYIALGLSIISTAILSTLIVPPKELKWALGLSLLGSLLGIPLQVARYGSLANMSGGEVQIEGSRIPTFAAIGKFLAQWLTSRLSPLRACIHPLWLVVLFASLGFAAASGYRNAMADVGFIYIVGICYHGGFKSFFASMIMGAFALALLALINLNFPLPGNIQRALSPLPGAWEERYITGGDVSTEWRVEMWKEALFTDRWISDKLLGDGIGVSSEQLDRQVNLRGGGGVSAGGLTEQQVTMLELGSYHSGPVHSVRMVGYVGLIVLLLAMFRLAVHAHRQIVRCKGTEWFPVALFFGIPLITQPFFFVFVFGEYNTAAAGTFLGMAIIRLLERNLPLPAWKKPERLPYMLRSHRERVAKTAREA
jgi:hypothetical protein